jgi:hypothetical protein
MSNGLENLACYIRQVLDQSAGEEGKVRVCERLSDVLMDDNFINTHLGARTQGKPAREILYEDPEFGFCICGHVYDGAAEGKPHDHGTTWAIYGQASGETEMTEWKVINKGSGNQPSLVEPQARYVMKRGDVKLYDVGVVHSPNRRASVKLIRIEGSNLDAMKRSNIEAKKGFNAP